MIRSLIIILCLLIYPNCAWSVESTSTAYNKEELKEDYRAFLQQLKSLNAQYKEVTGEISKVMKEEGVPTWDLGDGSASSKKDENRPLKDLGEGAYIKENDSEMQLVVDLPGYKKDSITLKYQGSSRIYLKATRKVDDISRSVERAFDLPAAADQKTTRASYQDGVLTVKMSKASSKEVYIPIR